MVERPSVFHLVRKARKCSFEHDRRAPNSKYEVSRSFLEYRQLLPPIDKLPLDQQVENIIARKGSTRILDVGCGQGRFLVDCKFSWGKNVECVGINGYAYHQIGPDLSLKRQLSASEVIIRTDVDAQSLSRSFPPNSFDLITAVRIAEYLADPFALIKGIHRLLRCGGVGLVHYFPLTIKPLRDAEKFADYLQSLGFTIRFNAHDALRLFADLGFVKNSQQLRLPLTYDRFSLLNGQKVLSYKLI